MLEGSILKSCYDAVMEDGYNRYLIVSTHRRRLNRVAFTRTPDIGHHILATIVRYGEEDDYQITAFFDWEVIPGGKYGEDGYAITKTIPCPLWGE